MRPASPPLARFGFALVALASLLPAAQLVEVDRLDASDGASLGRRVAVDTSVAFVGGGEEPSALGAVYVYERLPGGRWTETQKLVASTGAPRFGETLAVSGGIALVGGPEPALAGSVFVFERDGDTWTEVQVLTASDGGAGDAFRFPVALSGEVALIGGAAAGEPGAAYVFERLPGGTWSEVQKLQASDGTVEDRFGVWSALDGPRAVIGAWRGDGSDPSSGCAYVFEQQPGGSWLEVQKLVASDGATADHFGVCVALDGDRAAIGANFHDARGDESGAVYVFERQPGGSWDEVQKLAVDDGDGTGDYLGFSVALEGDLLATGCPGDDLRAAGAGAAYVFERDGVGVWQLDQKLTHGGAGPGDGLGTFVSLAGETVVATAPATDPDLGFAVVFAPPVASYGCEVNPAGSLVVLAGTPAIGTTLTVGVDNPLGTQAAGALPLLLASLAPWPGHPCGVSLPGLGMAHATAPGELLVGLGPAELVVTLLGPPWGGPGVPAPIDVFFPAKPALVGLPVFVQGVLADPTLLGGVGNAFTEALEILIQP